MILRNLLRSIRKSRFPYRPLITIEISRSSLLHNLSEFQKLNPNVPIAPVLKSNAYGHGLIHVANILEDSETFFPFFVIDSYFEALALRNEGIRTPLLVIGYTPAETIIQSKLKKVSFTITDLGTLHEVAQKAQRRTLVHIKVNTGMNRQGIQPSELDAAFSEIVSTEHVILEGILSHFADADNRDDTFTKKQIERWNSVVDKTLSEFPNLPYYHASNTPGHAFSKSVKANISRPGGGLYGLGQGNPALIDSKVHLKPVLAMKTIVSGIRTIEKGDQVGYGLSFTASQRMTIETIPVGYYEGVDRRLSNKGFVKIKGLFAPIVGRVSMNITIVDVSGIPDVKIGDEVIVISSNPEDKNSINNIAAIAGTIPYEIPVHIPQHLLRVVV